MSLLDKLPYARRNMFGKICYWLDTAFILLSWWAFAYWLSTFTHHVVQIPQPVYPGQVVQVPIESLAANMIIQFRQAMIDSLLGLGWGWILWTVHRDCIVILPRKLWMQSLSRLVNELLVIMTTIICGYWAYMLSV